jgi:molybdopterin converting factor small subunit
VSDSASTAVRVSVLIPGLLRSYTNGAAEVALALDRAGATRSTTVDDALAALDARFPGLRFRIVDEQRCIRPHVKIFVDRTQARDLATALPSGATLMIVGALSGG